MKEGHKEVMKLLNNLTIIVVASVLMLGVASAKEKEPQWFDGRVISQDLHSNSVGVAVMPIGNMIAGVPINRWSNAVVVESSGYRYEWLEVGRKTLVFTVNSGFAFYRDGNYFIVLDSNGKKHKFVAISITRM